MVMRSSNAPWNWVSFVGILLLPNMANALPIGGLTRDAWAEIPET